MRSGKRYISIFLATVISLSMVYIGPIFVKAETASSDSEAVYTKGNYLDYLESYSGISHPMHEVAVNAKDMASGSENIKKVSYLDSDNGILFPRQSTWAEYEVYAPEEGLYNIKITYATTENSNNEMKIGLLINGGIPFSEAIEMRLPRLYADTTPIRHDDNGNEIRPKQDMKHELLTQGLNSATGSYKEDYCFYFKEGYNKVRITTNGIEFYMDSITLYQKNEIPAYEEYMSRYADKKDSSGQQIKIQAQLTKNRTGSALYPSYDRVNAATEDSQGNLNDPAKIKINVIGGKLWDTPGQYITWDTTVEEDGFYYLALKFKQDTLDGLFCSRDIYIDGEIPFKGFSGVKFKYSADWQMLTLCDENDEPYKLYLTKGVHEIKIDYTIGELTDIIRQAQEILFDINELYRQIVMITGAKPDKYTDYFLDITIPDIENTLTVNYIKLDNVLNQLYAVTGAKGSKLAQLDALKTQLQIFIKDIEEIPLNLSAFKDNISKLGAWIVDVQKQPIMLDYIFIYSPGIKEPKATASFITSVSFSIRRFFASFNPENDYVSLADSENKSITVWINSGRDQAQVLKDLIDDSFRIEKDIDVNLELVPNSSLIEATLAGRGPDVSLGAAGDQPVNFAIRGALYDFTNFPDFDEVINRFYSSAVIPFEYQNGCYGIPETQIFNMFFYRTDVFNDLGISPPKTWDDLYKIIPVIQRNNLQITVPAISSGIQDSSGKTSVSNDAFAALLYQIGGKYYTDDGSRALFDQPVAIEAFNTYTEFFTNYEFPLTADFYSRFRTGEIVASIQPYNMYNQLAVAAPEINGLWEMVNIMGTRNENGEIDISQASIVTAAILFNNSKEKNAAWEFIKWWSSAEIQSSYGIELEALMGPASRYTPANIEALTLLPWNEAEANNLMTAWKYVKGIPNVPGSYYTPRSLTNAFRSVTYKGTSPRAALLLQNRYLNDELQRKRVEFGLED